jgi:hypothetical protein
LGKSIMAVTMPVTPQRLPAFGKYIGSSLTLAISAVLLYTNFLVACLFLQIYL